MRAAGWTAVKGRGIQAAYLYVRSGKSIEGGVEGVDYFAGDDAFATWWLREGRAQAGPDENDEQNSKVLRSPFLQHHQLMSYHT